MTKTKGLVIAFVKSDDVKNFIILMKNWGLSPKQMSFIVNELYKALGTIERGGVCSSHHNQIVINIEPIPKDSMYECGASFFLTEKVIASDNVCGRMPSSFANTYGIQGVVVWKTQGSFMIHS